MSMESETIKVLMDGASTQTGFDFLVSRIQHLCTRFEIRCGFIAKLESSNTIRTIAFFLDGQLLENFTYHLSGTPCEDIYVKGKTYYPLYLRDRFSSEFYDQENLDTFMGVPLFNKDKKTIGHLSFFNTGAIKETEVFNSVLAIMSGRMAAEFERSMMEKKLKEAQADLLETAMQMGRTFLANQVLHNVGNVLNSLNTSLSVIQSEKGGENLSRLTNAIKLLEAHQNEPGFLTSEKGQQLMEYMKIVRESVKRKKEQFTEELDQMAQAVEHIKSIINTQQSAHHACNLELMNPQTLMEEAMMMNSTSLHRHGITVSTDLEQVHDFEMARHSILQIIVNLLKNGVEALSENDPSNRKLTVKGTVDDGAYLLQVADNGIGIPQECLPKLFTYGFTTKKNGHGFGLNSCQRLAKDMGGELTVTSDGPNQGAVFTLRIPMG